MTLLTSKFSYRWIQRFCVLLLAVMALAGIGRSQFTAGEKGKVKGKIVSRSADKLKVQDSKTNSVEVVAISDDTKIVRDKSKVAFKRHEDMDVTAMVPGLTISAEGVGNANGGLDASKITFSPDVFAIEVAQEQQIIDNKASAGKAQTTANQGVAAATVAQTSANQAQSSANMAQTSANVAGATADAAGTVAVMDAQAIHTVNQRVSDLDDYSTVAEAMIFYPTNGYTLDAAAKADLDKLASLALSTDGYMIEIAGYASKTGTQVYNQQLSEDRAAAVANYLRNQGNIPMRRIVAPAGYGATHPDAPNQDPQGREINRRVDVKLLVNKAMS